MKLDRNINNTGRGKYGVVLNRKLQTFAGNGSFDYEVQSSIKVLERAGVLSWGDTTDSEFFVLKLKDRFAGMALASYAIAAEPVDPEYAADVEALAKRAGLNHPNSKLPD